MTSCLKVLFFGLLLLLTQNIWAVSTIDVSLEKGKILLTPVHGGDGSAWGKDNCSACHFKQRIHENAPVIKNIVKDVGFSSCAGCHGQNGTETPRLCTVCHNEQRLPNAPALKGKESHDFKVGESRKLEDQGCLACHYSSDMNGKFEPEIDLSALSKSGPNKTEVEFCFKCHNKTHQQAGFEMTARFINDPLVSINKQYDEVEKHGFLASASKGVYSGLRQGGEYRYGDVLQCSDCHAMHGTHNPKLIIDKTNQGLSKLAPSIRELPVSIDVGNGDYSQLCVTCHVMDKISDQGGKDAGNGLSGIHVVGVNCSQCHTHSIVPQEGWPATVTKDVSLEKGQLILTETHGFGGVGWGKEQCESCHLMNRIHLNAPDIRGIVEEIGFGSCTGCHGSNGTNVSRPCLVCHNEQRMPSAPIQKGLEKHDFKVNEVHELTDLNCVTCHQNSDMDGLFEAEIDLSFFPDAPLGLQLPYKSGVEFCLRCHNETHQQFGSKMEARFVRDPLVKIADTYKYLDVHGYPRGAGDRTYTGLSKGDYRYGDLVECTDCHAMHGTHNSKLIVDRTDAGMSKLDVSLRELPVFIDVVDGDYSQLCVTCHSMETLLEQGGQDTGNGLAGVHEVGTDCRKCHVHGMAAQTGL